MTLEARLAALEQQQALIQAREDIWQTIARYARGIDEQRDADLAGIFTDDVVLQTEPWTQRPLVGKALALKAAPPPYRYRWWLRPLVGKALALKAFRNYRWAFQHPPSGRRARRWYGHRLRQLVRGASTGGAVVLWLGQLRVGFSLRRWPVEDQPYAHYPGLHDHPGARLGHAGRAYLAFPATAAGVNNRYVINVMLPGPFFPLSL